MPGVIIVGAQWGDEGKGKIVDILSSQAHHVVRAQGGNNAGHTVLIGNDEFKLHLVPSGILHPKTQCYLGAGTVIDPAVLIREIQSLESRGCSTQGRFWISPAAHLIMPYHRILDQLLEKRKGQKSLGTTGSGIGPCYADKALRWGLRVAEWVRPDIFPILLKNVLSLKNEELTKIYGAESLDYDKLLTQYTDFARFLTPCIASVEDRIVLALQNNENVLFEGAQGTFLDITSGTYPFVTASNTVAGGVCAGAGIGPCHIDHTMGVVKAYLTRVGQGPFPTEWQEDETTITPQQAREFGTTTGRKRRMGWLDVVLLKKAVSLNGLQSIALTKLDILDTLKTIKIGVAYKLDGKRLDHLPEIAEDLAQVEPVYELLQGWESPTRDISSYEDLPAPAKDYIKRIETACQVPVSLISTGPERKNTIIIQNPFDA